MHILFDLMGLRIESHWEPNRIESNGTEIYMVYISFKLRSPKRAELSQLDSSWIEIESNLEPIQIKFQINTQFIYLNIYSV